MVKSQQQKIEDLLLLENNARYILHLINPKIILEPSSIEYRVVTERGIEQRLQLNKASEIDEVSGQISEYLQKIVAKTSDEKRAIKRLGYINDALNQLKDLTQVQAPEENDFESARTSLSTILLQDGVEVRFSGEADAGKSYRIIENTIKIAEQLGQGKIAEYLAMQLKKNKGFLGFGEPTGKYEGSININLFAADCFQGKFFVEMKVCGGENHYMLSHPELSELVKAEEKKPKLADKKNRTDITRGVDYITIFELYQQLATPKDNYDSIKFATQISINSRLPTKQTISLIKRLDCRTKLSVVEIAEDLHSGYHNPKFKDYSSNQFFKELNSEFAKKR